MNQASQTVIFPILPKQRRELIFVCAWMVMIALVFGWMVVNSPARSLLVFAAFVIVPLLFAAQLALVLARTRLVFTGRGVEYTSAFDRVSIPWEKVESISATHSGEIVLTYDAALLPRRAGWRRLLRSAADPWIPLGRFTRFRGDEPDEFIRALAGFAPHLFQAEPTENLRDEGA